LLFRAE